MIVGTSSWTGRCRAGLCGVRCERGAPPLVRRLPCGRRYRTSSLSCRVSGPWLFSANAARGSPVVSIAARIFPIFLHFLQLFGNQVVRHSVWRRHRRGSSASHALGRGAHRTYHTTQLCHHRKVTPSIRRVNPACASSSSSWVGCDGGIGNIVRGEGHSRVARHHGHRHEPLPVRARRDARHQDHRVRLPRHRHALPPLRHRSRARHPRRRPDTIHPSPPSSSCPRPSSRSWTRRRTVGSWRARSGSRRTPRGI